MWHHCTFPPMHIHCNISIPNKGRIESHCQLDNLDRSISYIGEFDVRGEYCHSGISGMLAGVKYRSVVTWKDTNFQINPWKLIKLGVSRIFSAPRPQPFRWPRRPFLWLDWLLRKKHAGSRHIQSQIINHQSLAITPTQISGGIHASSFCCSCRTSTKETCDSSLARRKSQSLCSVLAWFSKCMLGFCMRHTYRYIHSVGSPRIQVKFIIFPSRSRVYMIKENYITG